MGTVMTLPTRQVNSYKQRTIRHWIFKGGVATDEREIGEDSMLTVDEIKDKLGSIASPKVKDDYLLKGSEKGFRFEASIMWACVAATSTPSAKMQEIIHTLIDNISEQNKTVIIRKAIYSARFISPDVVRLLLNRAPDIMAVFTTGGVLTPMYDVCHLQPDGALLNILLDMLEMKYSDSQQAMKRFLSYPVDTHSGETAMHHIVASRSGSCLSQVLLRFSLQTRRNLLKLTDKYNLTPYYMCSVPTYKITAQTKYYSYTYYHSGINHGLMKLIGELCNNYTIMGGRLVMKKITLLEVDAHALCEDVDGEVNEMFLRQISHARNGLIFYLLTLKAHGNSLLPPMGLHRLLNLLTTSDIRGPKIIILQVVDENQAPAKFDINLKELPADCCICTVHTWYDVGSVIEREVDGRDASQFQEVLTQLQQRLMSHPLIISVSSIRQTFTKNIVRPSWRSKLPLDFHQPSESIDGSALVVCMTIGRPGWEEELSDVEYVLNVQLGFKVHERKDLVNEDLLSEIKDFCYKEGEKHDCMLIVVLAHGRQDCIVCKDKQGRSSFVYIQDIVTAMDVCLEIPKMLMLQCCRGEHEGQVNEHIRLNFSRSSTLFDPFPTNPRVKKAIQVPDNYFVSFSTLPLNPSIRGLMFKSLRNQLYDLFSTGYDHNYTEDWHSIMTDVAGRMSMYYQCLENFSSLRKHIKVKMYPNCPKNIAEIVNADSPESLSTSEVTDLHEEHNLASTYKEYLMKDAKLLDEGIKETKCILESLIENGEDTSLQYSTAQPITFVSQSSEKKVLERPKSGVTRSIRRRKPKGKRKPAKTRRTRVDSSTWSDHGKENFQRQHSQRKRKDSDLFLIKLLKILMKLLRNVLVEAWSIICYLKLVIMQMLHLKMPPPIRLANEELYFEDYQEFRPNMTPEEVLRAGSFGGAYFQRMYSSVIGGWCDGAWRELPSSWLEGLDIDTWVASKTYRKSTNKFKCRSVSSIKMQEKNGFIKEQDPYGWFQWYCRFYQGRRTNDDKRQIDRWAYSASLNGRWRKTLIALIYGTGASYDNATIAPEIRQNLQHWAYRLTESDYNYGEGVLKKIEEQHLWDS